MSRWDREAQTNPQMRAALDALRSTPPRDEEMDTATEDVAIGALGIKLALARTRLFRPDRLDVQRRVALTVLRVAAETLSAAARYLERERGERSR